jgi:glucose/mannose-6-phosphate isomerase
MTNADLADRARRLDPRDMRGAIAAFPGHFREGWLLAADLQPRHRAQDLDHLVVIGMGGSAMGGDLLRTYARPSAPVPVTVVRDYTLPAWVGPRTLVVASSYSGNTEETLAAFEEALDRRAPIYALTSGGDLHTEALQRDLPHVVLPGGMQPRAALGYSFGALLRVADKLGVVAVREEAYAEALAGALRQSDELDEPEGSRAAELAGALEGKLPVVYTGPGLMEAVGMRWRTQLHENAKQLAYGNVFAELNHNEIVGWENTPAALRERVAVVVLRDPDDHPQVQRRMDVTRDLLEGRAGAWIEVEPGEGGPLERMLTAVQLGDSVSFYLAMLGGVNPTPVDTIQELKRTLAA